MKGGWWKKFGAGVLVLMMSSSLYGDSALTLREESGGGRTIYKIGNIDKGIGWSAPIAGDDNLIKSTPDGGLSSGIYQSPIGLDFEPEAKIRQLPGGPGALILGIMGCFWIVMAWELKKYWALMGVILALITGLGHTAPQWSSRLAESRLPRKAEVDIKRGITEIRRHIGEGGIYRDFTEVKAQKAAALPNPGLIAHLKQIISIDTPLRNAAAFKLLQGLLILEGPRSPP